MEQLDAEAVAEMVGKTVGGAGVEPECGSLFERSGQLAASSYGPAPAEQAAGS